MNRKGEVGVESVDTSNDYNETTCLMNELDLNAEAEQVFEEKNMR